MGIKVKNVSMDSAIRKLAIPVTSISSCDTQRVMCPFAGSIDSLVFHTTAAVTAGMHWTIKSLAGTTLLDFSKTLVTVASAAILAPGNGIGFSAGSVLEVNTSSTANFAPVTVVVVAKIDNKEK